MDDTVVDTSGEDWLVLSESLGDPEVKDLILNGAWTILVEGWTDSQGTVEHNLLLSQERANAVKAEIVNLGYPPEVIQAVGMGIGGDAPYNRRAIVRIIVKVDA